MIKAEIVDMDEDKAQITNVRLNMERGHLDLVKLAEVFSVEKKKGHSEAEIGRGYGFSQQRISQILAIIGYSEGMKRLLTTRVVGEGHTRAIVGGIKDQKLQLQVADEVIKRRLSTRETEELIRELKGVKKGKRASKKSSEVAELSPTMPSATAVSVTLAGTAPNAPNTALTDTDATAARQTTGDVDAKIPQSPANPGVGTQNPSQLRHDFVDRITPIEFAIRGVKMQETIGSVTVVLLSYLRYLGGEEWADMSMGDCIDFIVRRFCHEHDIDLRIRRILPEDDIGKSSQEGAGSRNKFTI